MPGLGETTAKLSQMRKGSGGRSTSRYVETSDFGLNPGGLRMLSHIPQGLAEGAALVVVLHGCTQHAETYADGAGWSELADRLGFAVLAPEQVSTNNVNRCFNWFLPANATRDAGEAASIAAMITHSLKVHRLNPDRVFITGLSAGGAMTMVMLATYPELFAAGAVVAGLPYGVATDVMTAIQAMQRVDARSPADLGRLVVNAAPPLKRWPRLTIWHGDADRVVNVSNAHAAGRQWIDVQGLSEAEVETTTVERRTKTVWLDPNTSEALVELNVLKGLGHGTPLSTTGPDPIGAAGPFLLEAGVSSTDEIARFWHLLPVSRPSTFETTTHSDLDAVGRDDISSEPLRVGDKVMSSIAGYVSSNVADVISKALKAAGLLR